MLSACNSEFMFELSYIFIIECSVSEFVQHILHIFYNKTMNAKFLGIRSEDFPQLIDLENRQVAQLKERIWSIFCLVSLYLGAGSSSRV